MSDRDWRRDSGDSSKDGGGLRSFRDSHLDQAGLYGAYGSNSVESHLNPRQRVFQSRESALKEKQRELAAARAVIREIEGGLRDQASLEGAKAELLAAPETARRRIEDRFKLEAAVREEERLAAELRRMQAEFKLDQEQEYQDSYARGAREREADRRIQHSLAAKRAALEEAQLDFEREQIEAKRAALKAPPPSTTSSRPKSNPARRASEQAPMPKELLDLKQRADDIGKIERLCNKLRADAYVARDTGAIATDEELETKLDDIQRWAANAVEDRLDQDG